MLLLLIGGRLDAQQRRAAPVVARRAPDGPVLARVPGAAALPALARDGGWVKVQLDGWISNRALRSEKRDGFDVAVSAPGGENLRIEPNGVIVARLQPNTRLERTGARGAWVHVRRSVWIERSTAASATKVAAARAPEARQRQPDVRAPAAAYRPMVTAVQSRPAAARPDTTRAPPARTDSAGAGERVETARQAPLFVVPEGGQLGTLESGSPARVLGRSGEWVRVQTEGWVREADIRSAPGGAMIGVSAAEVRANPDRYVGQSVEWRLQVVSIQVADELRPEIPAGSPYLLTRGPLPEPGFVYVITSRDQLTRFRGLGPLAEVTLRVRIRAARTKYLATPVAELESIVDTPPARH